MKTYLLRGVTDDWRAKVKAYAAKNKMTLKDLIYLSIKNEMKRPKPKK